MAPFIMALTAYKTKIHCDFEDQTRKANVESVEVAIKAACKICTVIALNK